MKEKFNTFIFDLDGTLVNTSPGFRHAILGQTLGELGVPVPEDRIIDDFWYGEGRDQLIRSYFGLDPQKFWAVYSRYDTVELRKQFTEPYSDVDIIKELKERGYKVGIVTSAAQHIIALETGMIGRGNFDEIVSLNFGQGIPPKPDPRGLEICLSRLKSRKEEAIYGGNASEDVRMAQNAHVFDVFVDRREHEFPGLNPSLTIYSLYELRQFYDGA